MEYVKHEMARGPRRLGTAFVHRAREILADRSRARNAAQESHLKSENLKVKS
jgi:hypothetical protein